MEEHYVKCVEQQLRKYRQYAVELRDVEIQIEGLEAEYDPATIPSIDPGKEYVVGGRNVSSVERKAVPYVDKIIPLQVRKGVLQRLIKRIDNAMRVLSSQEREIIEECVIGEERYSAMPYSYRQCKRLKRQAVEKMAGVMYGKK